MRTVVLAITFRDGRAVRVKASEEFAAALVMVRPVYIARLIVEGGVDDLVRSHVPTAWAPWEIEGRLTHGAVN